jgi:tetratricopeptide (TPR) repeat protein
MIEEPEGKFPDEEASPQAETPESEAGEQGVLTALSSFASKLTFTSLLKSVPSFLSWLAAGKVRISLAAGVFAGVIVALGFVVFDMGEEARMLKHKYPHASSSYERSVLYARDLVLQKQCGDAEPILRKLIEKRGGTDLHADALLLLAECLDTPVRDPDAAKEARGMYERFIAEYPADRRVPLVSMRLAENLSKSGLYSESDALYEKLRRMPADTLEKGEVEFSAAQNHYRTGDLARATELLEQVRQKYSDTTVGYDSTLLLARILSESGKPHDAKRILGDFIGEAPGTPHAAVALRMLAQNALDGGAYEGAIGYCTRWLKESPLAQDQVDVMLILGQAKLAVGAPDDARAVASDIIAFSPDSPRLADAIVLQGESLEALGKIDDAEASYLEAARTAPEASSPHERLARLYLSKGNLPEAIEKMKYACELTTREDALFLELAKLYRLNGENVSALGVLEQFARDRQLNIFIGEAYLTMADVLLELDRPDEAYRTLDRLLATGTATVGQPVVLEKQADILATVGLYDEAVDAYRSALEAGAQSAAMVAKIAGTHLAAGKAQECLDELASIKDSALSPSERFDFLELKARSYLELGMFGEARRAIHDAIALRTERENFSTLALLMQANLALQDGKAASKTFDVTVKLIEHDQTEAPPEARRIILDWARYLYEKGEYAQAAKAYSVVESPRFPLADVAWATYQEGNCYYHMTDYDRAKETYSRLADEFSGSEWVRFAEQKQEIMGIMPGT